MRPLVPLMSLVALVLTGCATTTGSRLGPPPDPVLATRPPRVIEPVPRPVPAPGRPTVRRSGTLRGATVVVDAGHGGHDPGALGRGPVPEKTINLDVARRVATLLREQGANVTLTRDGDSFIELDGRAAIADRSRCDLFVSIHADSARRASATGLTVFIGRDCGPESRQAAQRIAAAIEAAGLELRGVQTAGFRVLVGHSRPAVLVECGFLSNREEAQRLATPAYRARVAEAIAEGIADHLEG